MNVCGSYAIKVYQAIITRQQLSTAVVAPHVIYPLSNLISANNTEIATPPPQFNLQMALEATPSATLQSPISKNHLPNWTVAL